MGRAAEACITTPFIYRSATCQEGRPNMAEMLTCFCYQPFSGGSAALIWRHEVSHDVDHEAVICRTGTHTASCHPNGQNANGEYRRIVGVRSSCVG